MIKKTIILLFSTYLLLQNSDSVIIKDSILDFGEKLYLKGDYSESIVQFKKCVEVFKKNKKTQLLGKAYNNLGRAYSQIGKSEEALANYLSSLEISKQLNDSLSLAKTYKNIGTLYEEQRDFENAMSYYNRSIEIAKQKNDLFLIADCQNNMGIIYEQQTNYRKAIELYSSALKIYTSKNDEQRISMVLNNLAIVYKYLKNYPEAIKNYNAALALSEKLGDKFMIAANQTNLGNVYALTGNYKKSLELCFLANKNAKEIEAKEIVIESYEGISTAYEKLQNLSEAIKYRKIFEQEKESFINLERSNQLAEMQTKFETQKKEAEITFLNQETKIRDLKIKEQASLLTKKNYQITAFLFLLMGLFVIAYFWKKSQNLKNILISEKIIKETEEHERIRIAKDIHDDLGSGLSKINFLSELISQKSHHLPEILSNSQAVKETSKKMIENMRDLIWALNSENTTLANFFARMREYATDYLEDYPIEIQNNFPENIPQTPINKESYRELFMVVKESLNNIVKHSKATKVDFMANIDAEFLKFTIRDNGVGFTFETIKNGNGLQNMQTRLKNIDGICEIVSENRNGTEINVSVPLIKILK